MSSVYNEDFHAPEGLSVGNWAWGNVIIKPEPGQDVSIDVAGLNLDGEGLVYFQASVKSAYPWVAAGTVGIGPMEESGDPSEDPSQFRIYFSRKTAAETRIHWMVWREPS